MSPFLNEIADILSALIPLLGLFTLFLIGYSYAVSDFKPKPISPDEETRLDSRVNIEPIRRQRELSLRELGLDLIDSRRSLPPEAQRRLYMERRIRDYSSLSPNETANIVKGWLREK